MRGTGDRYPISDAERDDLLSATRYALMGLRFATTGQGGTSAAGAAAADNPTTTTAGFNPLDW